MPENIKESLFAHDRLIIPSVNRDDLQLLAEKALLKVFSLVGYQIKPKVLVTKPIDVLDLAIRNMMERDKDIFFVQIGAHDGRTGDPISPYITTFGWKGLLIEPQPAVFVKLREYYAGRSNLIFENVAIGETEGTMTLYRFKDVSVSDHASMLTSTRKHYLRFNSDRARGSLDEIQVPMRTLASLLAQHGISKVDLLQIDTEGFDFQILRSIDFSVLRPRIIHFESNFLNGRQRRECARLLSENGYAMLELGIDTLACLQDENEALNERMRWSRVGAV